MNKNSRINFLNKAKKKAVSTALAVGLLAGTVGFGANAVMADTTVNTNTEISAAEDLGSVQAVVEKSMPSVVTISMTAVREVQSFYGGTQQQEAQGAGTGVIVAQNDTELFIATNNHVVEGATSLSVGFNDGASCEAVIRGTDPQTDLAVIAVKLADISEETMSEIKVAEIGSSDELSLGEQVVAIGNSLGAGQSVTTGIISAFGREIPLSDGQNTFVSSDLIQTDASINPGNSGGALLNMKGELVGINEAKSSYTSSGATVDNVGYAIPISKAMPILNELMSQEAREKAAEPGYLGVTCKDVTSESDLVTVYGFPEGVYFLEVIEGGPCAAAGFRKGDIITSFDGRTITSFNGLREVLEYYSAGEQVEIKALRMNDMSGEYEEVTGTVTLCGYETLQNTYTAG